MLCSEVMQGGSVSGKAGGRRGTDHRSQRNGQRAKFATQPWPGRAELDTTGQWAYAFARRGKPKSEITVDIAQADAVALNLQGSFEGGAVSAFAQQHLVNGACP